MIFVMLLMKHYNYEHSQVIWVYYKQIKLLKD